MVDPRLRHVAGAVTGEALFSSASKRSVSDTGTAAFGSTYSLASSTSRQAGIPGEQDHTTTRYNHDTDQQDTQQGQRGDPDAASIGGVSIGTLDSTDVLVIDNDQIVSIDLTHRSIGDERGFCLASALEYCPQVSVLRLADNRMHDRSLSKVLGAAFRIAFCEELDLSFNEVGDNCVKLLADYLQVSFVLLLTLFPTQRIRTLRQIFIFSMVFFADYLKLNKLSYLNYWYILHALS